MNDFNPNIEITRPILLEDSEKTREKVLIQIKKNRLYAFYSITVGISITALTYVFGFWNHYVIVYGPIIFGVILFVKSFIEENKHNKQYKERIYVTAYNLKDWIILSILTLIMLGSLGYLAISTVLAEKWSLEYESQNEVYYIDGYTTKDACIIDGKKDHPGNFACGQDCTEGINCSLVCWDNYDCQLQ